MCRSGNRVRAVILLGPGAGPGYTFSTCGNRGPSVLAIAAFSLKELLRTLEDHSIDALEVIGFRLHSLRALCRFD
jgi:hypothetical protein